MSVLGEANVSEAVREQRQELRCHGFVRVDGLRYKMDGQEHRYPQPGDITFAQSGERWETNNGMLAIQLATGERWIRKLVSGRWDVPGFAVGFQRGMFVPCSNGEQLDQHELFTRLTDPSWDPPVL